ncbi:hypothetical protein FITA111629_06470 [Filibacter tadaridae]|uniref:Uncharacterized protein n=1 Tax=Filibacter tadaridae TaxID=2483811 RepID=A0A3P5XZ65_9BACL|nr:hypothetical protein [Filibacter tadaridae]VDC33497.1 hypothetical protein FILTAD_02907 [Filibacter tadaridae]
MDKRVERIAEEAKVKFGLEAYELERHSIYKERDSMGTAVYMVNLEWFPKNLKEPVEEDCNPDGTASIDYMIRKEQFRSVTFVDDLSLSTMTQFPNKSIEEVSTWLEKETGLVYGESFKLTKSSTNGFQFESDIDGISLSPSCIINVEFDEVGKLISYHTYGEIPSENQVEKSVFTLTLEEIEPLVKKQLQLVKFPSEEKKCFVPVYAMEEVFITVDGTRMIPFLEHERTEVKTDIVIEWLEPLTEEIAREEIEFLSEVTADVAFGNTGTLGKLTLSDQQIEQCKVIVTDVLRTELPDDSGMWKLVKLQCQENFIEAHCKMSYENSTLFNRKFVVFIHPEKMSVLNFMDNGSFFEIFDTFTPADKEVVTHDEAFEKMLPYISLDPTYVYDLASGKYILCGLLDAAEGVNAVTGEIIALGDI